jgi:hypothetical protein
MNEIIFGGSPYDIAVGVSVRDARAADRTGQQSSQPKRKSASSQAGPEAGLEVGTVVCPTCVHRKAPLPTALRGGTTGAGNS